MPKTFKTSKGIYTIPDDQTASFTKDFPDAQEVQSYVVGKDTFDIPVNDVHDFTTHYPNAKPLGFDSQEVKQQYNQPAQPQQQQPSDAGDAMNAPTYPQQNDNIDWSNNIAGIRQLHDQNQQAVKAQQDYVTSQRMAPGLVPVDNTPDKDLQANLEGEEGQINATATGMGVKPEDLKDVMGKLPYVGNANQLKNAIQLKQDNPTQFNRYVAAQNSQMPLAQAIREKEKDPAVANNVINQMIMANGVNPETGEQLPRTFEQARQGVQTMISLTHQYIDNADDQDKIIDNIKENAANNYGGQIQGTDQTLNADPNKAFLNRNEKLGLQFIQDTDPATAQTFAAATINPENLDSYTDENGKKVKSPVGEIQATGLSEQKAKLAATGIDLRLRADNEHIAQLVATSKQRPLTDAETADYNRFNTDLQSAQSDLEKIHDPNDPTYGKAAQYEIRNIAQELGQQNHGLFATEGLKFLQEGGSGVNSIVTGLQGAFSSGDNDKRLQLMGIGQNIRNESNTYVRQANAPMQTFAVHTSPELQKGIDDINNNKDLTDDQKQQARIDLLSTNHDWYKQPTDPTFNLKGYGMLYGMGDAVNSIGSFVLNDAALGGLGNVSKVKKALTTFGAVVLQEYDKDVQDNLRNNKPNPYGSALLKSSINGAAMVVGEKVDAIKKILGGTAAGDLVDKLSDDEILNIAKSRPSSLKTFGEGIIKGGLEGLKGNAQMVAAGTAGQVANDAISGNLQNPSDYFKQAALQFVTTSPLALFGVGGKISELNEVQKHAWYDMASNPDEYIKQATDAFTNGAINKDQLATIKDNIETASSIFDKTDFTSNKGKPLTDDKKADLLLSRFKEDGLKEQASKNMPEARKEKLQEAIDQHKAEQEQIYVTPNKEADISTEPSITSDEQAKDAEANAQAKEIVPQEPQTEGAGQQTVPSLKPETNEPVNIKADNADKQGEQQTEEAQPANASPDKVEPSPKEYTSKTGRQKLTYDDSGNPKVIDTKTGVEVSKKTTKKVIKEAAENYDFTQGKRAEFGDTQFRDEREADSTNPVELAQTYIGQQPEGAELSSKEQQIADYGIGKVKESSYNEFGDRNNMNMSKAKSYLNKDGRSIDVVAKEMSDHYDTDITPQDIVDFMDKFPNGEQQALALHENDIALQAKEKFQKLTGLPLNEETATIALKQHYDKLTEDQQNIAKEDYDTKEQLDATYWREYEKTNGFAEDSKGSEIKHDETTNPTSSTIEEPANGDNKLTGIKKAISEPDRLERGLPKVDVPRLGSDAATLKHGKDLVDSGKIKPIDVANRVIDEGGIYSPYEASAMLYYGHQLAMEEKSLRSDLSNQKDESDRITTISKLQQLDDDIDAKTKADRINSNSWGILGNKMQIEVNSEFSPAKERSIIKENYGGEIPKDVQAKLDKAIAERDEAVKKYNDREQELAKENDKKAVDTAVREAKKNKTVKKVEDIKKEREGIIQNIKDKLKEQRSRLSSNPIPVEVLPDVAKLVINYAEEGVVKLSDFVDRLYDDLKDLFPGMTKEHADEAIRNSFLVVEKEKLSKKADRLESKVQSGDILPKNKPVIHIKQDADLVKIQQRIINAEHVIRMEKQKSYNSQKGIIQRGLGWLVRWNRRLVLSSPQILEKLAAAATIGGGVSSTPEEVVGGMFSKLFKGIADKAPIEGYFNAKAEGKFWGRFLNFKQSFKNAVDIAKTGSTPLSKKYGDVLKEHYAGFDFGMDLHSIIKDPLKEAEMQRAMEKYTAWAAKNGYDIEDPLIHQAIELAAYKKGNYAIFNNDNALSSWYREQLNRLDKSGTGGQVAKGVADLLIPVNKVPVNIVSRIGLYTTGLARGIKNVYDAYYKKGIENLTNDQAEIIMRQLKKGSVGNALLLAGFFGTQYLGGLWTNDDPNNKRKRGDLKANEMEINGVKVDPRIQHAMPFEIMQFGATLRRIYDTYHDKGTNIPISAAEALTGTIGVAIDQTPMLNTPYELIGAATDPKERQKFVNNFVSSHIPKPVSMVAEAQDVDEKGNPVKREVKTVLDAFKSKIPGLRETLSKEPIRSIPESDQNKPSWKLLTDKGVELPTTNVDQIKLKIGGKEVGLTDAQKDKFAEERTKFIDDFLTKSINKTYNGKTLKDMSADELKAFVKKVDTRATEIAKLKIKK